jgi:arylsulfatase A-like enzyme
MELRSSDDELYKSRYRDQFAEIPLPKTYIPWEQITTPRIPQHVYNGVYLPSYDYVRRPHSLRERRTREYQTITGMDRMIGRLRAELERLGLTENTIIVFSTDHGIHHGEHGLGGKCFLYEEDLRIPLVLYDPRLSASKRGQVRDELVLVPDLAPTVLDLLDVLVPDRMQGQSLAPLIRNESAEWRQDFFCEQLMDIQNYPRSESVRTKEWKYIRYFARTEDPSQTGFFRGTLDNYNQCLASTLNGEQPVYEELYHLREDQWEEQNLVTDPAYSTVLDQLRARILILGREAKGDDAPPLTIPL